MPLIILRRITAFQCSPLLFVAAVGVLCASPKATSPSIAINISTPKDVVEAGTKTEVNIAVTNVSDRRITLSHDSSGGAVLSGFRVNATRVDGKSFKIMKYYWDVTGRREPKEEVKDANREYVVVNNIAPLPVEPKATVKYNEDVDDLYDLSVSGQYTIQVSGTDPVTHETVESNKITITVTK